MSFIYSANRYEGLSYLNNIRAHLGMIKFKVNRSLNKSSLAHSNYLIQNQSTGHYERKGAKGYTGNTPSHRVKKAGYISMVVRENISTNIKSERDSIVNLFAAIYHRFTFLDFTSDEIGVGYASASTKYAIQNVYTYNLGSSKLSALCRSYFPLFYGSYYMENSCRDSKDMIPIKMFKKSKEKTQRQNAKIVYYPYAGARNIYPAFYNEKPDPLPNYKVSGFPISVQFNPAYYKSVKLKAFRLYDALGKEIKKVKILQKNNDPHHIFTERQFALMPLARLEYGQKYTLQFEALVDKKIIRKKWSFYTQKPKYSYYRISKNTQTIEVKAGKRVVLYIVPSHRHDILSAYSTQAGLKVKFLDPNTVEVFVPKSIKEKTLKISFSNRKSVSIRVKR
jgi:hypothetical protein